MRKAAVISDLHLFSRRSMADVHMASILDTAAASDVFILGGDTFDFKWTTFDTLEDTVEQAGVWLENVIQHAPQCQIEFLLGNHDHHPLLIERLEALSASQSRFRWHPYVLRFGDHLFLHGDVADPQMNREKLIRFREKCVHHRRQGRVMNWLYDAALVSGVATIGGRILYPARRVARRLTRYLDEIGHGAASGVRHVYFGHTHLALGPFLFDGMTFHNGGAPIRGAQFHVLTTKLS